MQEKLTTLAEAISLVNDGDVVALQNMATQAAPMTLVRELIRQEKRGLGLVVLVGGMAVDWLAAAGVIEGRTCCAYPAVRPDLEQAGSVWVDPNETFDNAHVDGNLVTAPAWPAHPAWIREFLKVLGTPVGG